MCQCKRIYALPKMCSDCFVSYVFHLIVYNDHLSVSVNTDLHVTVSGYMLFHVLDIPYLPILWIYPASFSGYLVSFKFF